MLHFLGVVEGEGSGLARMDQRIRIPAEVVVLL